MEFARLATRIWLGLFVLDAGVGALQALLTDPVGGEVS